MEDSDGDCLRLSIPPLDSGYADAQVDDYRRLPRRDFPWQPPVRFSVRARCSHSKPVGTLGFGFWNDPFTVSLGQGGAARRLPAAPRAAWFFYGSPPNCFAFHPDSPKHGWRPMALTAPSIPSYLLAPLAAGAIALAQIPGVRRSVMRSALRAVGAQETALDVGLEAWHEYALEWEEHGASFLVDGSLVLRSSLSIPGPLGFVAWIDNQYAVASPEGGFRFGVLPTSDEQWLEIAALELESIW